MDTVWDFMNSWAFMGTMFLLLVILGIVYYVLRNKRTDD